MNKEQIVLLALDLAEYERKIIAAVLIASMLTEMSQNEAMTMIRQLVKQAAITPPK